MSTTAESTSDRTACLRASLVGLSLLLCGAGCTTGYRITQQSDVTGLAKPDVVYVVDFAVDPSEVKVDPGGPLQRIRNRLAGGGDGGQDAQQTALAHQVAETVATDLVQQITAMGLPAQRMTRDQTPPDGAIVVAGQFVDLDEGNRVRRMAIGFHQGQSSVSAQVQLYRVTGARAADQLLDFTAIGTSPPTPGAAVTMGAGAAAQAAAAAGGVKELTSSLQADAGRLAEQVAKTLQGFFARQGWTAAPSDLPVLP